MVAQLCDHHRLRLADLSALLAPFAWRAMSILSALFALHTRYLEDLDVPGIIALVCGFGVSLIAVSLTVLKVELFRQRDRDGFLSSLLCCQRNLLALDDVGTCQHQRTAAC